MKLLRTSAVSLMLFFSYFQLARQGQLGILVVLLLVVLLLLFHSLLCRVLSDRNSPLAEELKLRTSTWWWMVAIFILAIATHKILSFLLLGFICFSALREFYSMMPMQEGAGEKALAFEDRSSILLSYLSIPIVLYLAYAQWYNLFIVFIPVYLFLFIPVVFVAQDRTEGAIKSLGIISLGLMFFVYNFGHCLLLLNFGAVVLLYCFALTEARDVLSYWLEKGAARWASGACDSSALAQILRLRAAPSITGEKTWGAAIISALLVAMLSLVFVQILPEFPRGRLSYPFAAILGFSIGMLGFMGDLVFAMVKRDLKLKKTGALLAGHGGIIDRIRGLVYTVPVTFHLIYWVYY